MQVYLINNELAIATQYAHRQRAKATGARWDARRKVWLLPANAVAAAAVIEQLPDHAIAAEVHALAEQLGGSRASLDAEIPITVAGKTPWGPQREAFQFCIETFRQGPGGVLLDMAMGSGKSRVGIDLVQNMNARKVLVLAPKSVVAVWPFQALRWAVELNDWHVVVAGDTRPEGDDESALLPEHWKFEHRSVAHRVAAIRKSFLAQRRKHVMVVVNWESYWRDPMANLILGTDWGLVLADEIHRIKAPRGEASLFASKLEQGGRAPYRVGLSGTPMPHSPLDAFATMRFLNRSLFGMSVTVFRNTYLNTSPYVGNGRAILRDSSGSWFKTPAIEQQFLKRYGSITYRAEKDTASLPPLLEEYRWATLEPKAAKHYVELREELYTEVAKAAKDAQSEQELLKGVVTSPNCMTLVTKLQQLLSGYVVDEAGATHYLSQAKSKLLADLLLDIPEDEPVIVFARFIEDLNQIEQVAANLKRKYGEVSGRRKDVKAVLRVESGLRVIGVQIQSGSVGVDYTAACYVNFWSVWGGGDFAQARERAYRPPQKRPVTQYALVTKAIGGEAAVDFSMMESLRSKESALHGIARRAIAAVWRNKE